VNDVIERLGERVEAIGGSAAGAEPFDQYAEYV
jgi:hypothetical protein